MHDIFDKENFGKRLEEFIESKNKTVNKFTKTLTHTRTERIYTAIRGETIPKVDLIHDMINAYPDLDIYWLITGKKQAIITDINQEIASNESKSKLEILEIKLKSCEKNSLSQAELITQQKEIISMLKSQITNN